MNDPTPATQPEDDNTEERAAIIAAITDLIGEFAHPENLMPIVHSILEANSMVACIWSPDDMDEILEEYPEEHRAAIKASALEGGFWAALGETSDVDWVVVGMAVAVAASELGIADPHERDGEDDE